MPGLSYNKPFPRAKKPTGLSSSPATLAAFDASAVSSSSSKCDGSVASNTLRRDGVRNGEKDVNGDENSFLGVANDVEDCPPLTRLVGVLGSASCNDGRESGATNVSSLEVACLVEGPATRRSRSPEVFRPIGVLIRLSL